MSQFNSSKNSAQGRKKIIFNTSEVAKHFSELKASGRDSWWTGVLSFDWGAFRKGGNGTHWANVNYTDAAGVSGRLILRINGERHSGQIMPKTEAGVAELRALKPQSNVSERTKSAAILIQKWSARVPTRDDEITVLTDEAGVPKYPGDDKLSPYYQVACGLSEAFTSEAKERVDRGTAFIAKVAEMKRSDKNVTVQAVLEATGPRRAGDLIVSASDVTTIRKSFPAQKDVDAILKGATIASCTKITNLVQEYISDHSQRNAGCLLPNPMTRIVMKMGGAGVQTTFYDKGLPYTADGKSKYDVAKVDGLPISEENVHKFIESGCLVDGIVDLGAICISNMAISLPPTASVLVVEAKVSAAIDLDDVYDDAESASFTAAPPARTADRAAEERRAPAAQPPEPTNEELSSLLTELG
jgi:hypothetical protein